LVVVSTLFRKGQVANLQLQLWGGALIIAVEVP
jgi:hypothetical protein